MLRRRGVTLAELLVALTLAGLVLTVATRSLLVQQRAARRVSGDASADARFRMASDLLRSQLTFAVPRLGDLSTAPADTALQLRVPVAVGVVCASYAGAAILTVADADSSPTGAVFSPSDVGDTVWWYPGERKSWAGRRVVDVSPADVECRPLGLAAAPALRLRLATPETLPLGMPARVTRQIRYSLYRSGDGSWQLGRRDWSDALHRFAPPQPIAGPFARRGAAGDATGFRFFDASDAELGPDDLGLRAHDISRVRLTMLAQDQGALSVAAGRREQLEIPLRGRATP